MSSIEIARSALRRHWREYLIEAAALCAFMVSAAFFATVLEHPGSPARAALSDGFARRALMGIAMGLTAIAIIYSPWGERSGAHMNPSMTLTFLRLRKIAKADAVGYVAAQFLGGVAGLGVVGLVLRSALGDPAVRWVATVPGARGLGAAFAAEVAISFVLMMVVLVVSNAARIARFTVAAVLSQAAKHGNDTGAAAAVEAVALSVSDLDRSVAFFTGILDFTKLDERELAGEGWERLQGVFGLHSKTVRLRLGEEQIELRQALAPRGRPMPVPSRSNDRWFQHVAIITSDMDKAYARLCEHRVEHASSAPQRLPDWNRNAAGIRAFYFKDPDGHPLEILQFPKGKGSPKWHAQGALFLGIDHTAIVVGDTDASLAFWRDALHMKVAGGSENFGPEQERLNNVFGAHLRITTLRASSGPGVELLEYLTPGDGRAMPLDGNASDLWQWETVTGVRDPESAAQVLRAGRVRFVSSARVSSGSSQAFVVRDPDGHAVELVGPAR